VAVCVSVTEPGSDGKPCIDGSAIGVNVVVAVTVMYVYVLSVTVAAVALTVAPWGASALTAVDKLVQPAGSGKPDGDG
jgi:hypothetical protein